MTWTQVAMSLFTIVQLLFAVWMFVRRQPRRDHFHLRASIVFAGFAIGTVAATWVGFSAVPSLMGEHAIASQFLTFTGVLVVIACCVMFCFDTPMWTALFCCTAGYTVQNLASGCDGLIRLVLAGGGADPDAPLPSTIGMVVSTILIFGIVYLTFVRQIEERGLVEVEDHGMLLMMLAVILLVIVFDLVNKSLPGYGVPTPVVVILRLIHGAVCAFLLIMEYEMLYSKRLALDVAAAERTIADGRRHYEASQRSIAAIDARCHDLRQQVRGMREGGVDDEALERLENDITIYDSTMRTGNEALDVILTERRLLCEREGITFTCMADGAALSFMDPADIYALFGDALDGAMATVAGIEDESRRSIGLDVRRNRGMVVIHVECYSDGGKGHEGEASGRGYGMRSMLLVAERYHGTLVTNTRGDAVTLDVMLPLPS